MGHRYTTLQDRAAGPDGAERPLTVAQADDAWYERLAEIHLSVHYARAIALDAHGPWTPVHVPLNRVEDKILQLIEDADYVRIAPS